MKTKMKDVVIPVLIVVCCGVLYAQDSKPSEKKSDPNFCLAVPAKPVRLLADGFIFTEGPAADSKGNIFFTDIPNNRIHQWSLDGKLSMFMENSGGANGLFFGSKGDMIACAGGEGRLVSIDPKGTVTVLVDKYEGKPFNSPNDLWMTPKGGIYFSDPRYGQRDNLPQDGEHVYYLSPDRKKLIRVINDMVRPNGLIGTPDGKTLYVADHGSNKTFVYKINPDGTLTDKKLFAPQGSDGMTIDRYGNIYLTGRAVTVYAPDGTLIQTIEVPQTPSNVCFGGKDNKTLFITARKALYAVGSESKLYSFTLDDIDGKPVTLSQYQGKVLLIVNVASKCGYTKQYAGLQKLYEKYKDQGFVILGFPANNFGGQEPGTNADVKTFCSTQFHVSFPMFAKISVAGQDIHPLYQYLTSPQDNGEFGKPIGWNFTKYLIGKDGKTLTRYPSEVDPSNPQLLKAVEDALKE